MTRTHAWVKKGQEYVERTPMNWGGNSTLTGAMRRSGWIVLTPLLISMRPVLQSACDCDLSRLWLMHIR